MIHQDLKPLNSLLSKHNHVHIIDFGIAKEEGMNFHDFNNETFDSFVKSSFVHNCFIVFENDFDFFFVDSENSDNKIQKQSKQNKLKDKYPELSSIITMNNTKYFDKPDSYSLLFVEIEFFANILKSFTDTLEILKKLYLLLASTVQFWSWNELYFYFNIKFNMAELFDFYMNLGLKSYSFWNSKIFQEEVESESIGRFSWNINYKTKTIIL